MSNPTRNRRLQDILHQKGYLQGDLLQELSAQNDDRALAEQLLAGNHVSADQLAEALADHLSLDYTDLVDFTIPDELYRILPAADIYRYRAIPWRIDNGVLKVAVAYPVDLDLGVRLEHLCGMPVELVLSSRPAIDAALKRSQGTSEVLRDLTNEFTSQPAETELQDGLATPLITTEEQGPVVKLVNSILAAALAKRASDIHIETYEQGIRVKYRIDGVLYGQAEPMDRSHHDALISRIKVMAELDIAERRIPQDGRFKMMLDNRLVDFRVSILPGVFGEDVVIRVLDKTSITEGVERLQLESLGMPEQTLKAFRKSIHEPYGMVLITGPTGSGKTTTLYAAMSELNSGDEKIITIEDPVEYQLEGVVQIPVNEKKNLTFARGLRSILRHDPDKIMVGEIRDSETVQIAVQSALTGHLVFTTVHANNSFDVISRFSHMGVDVYNFVSALNCVLAQRLVRSICPQCRTEVHESSVMLEQSGLNPKQYAKHTFYHGQGCNHCGHTGYRGRTAITEFLDLSPRIREMIAQRCSMEQLEAAAREEGMHTLRESALAKALAGETTLAEINRVTFVD